MGPADPKAAAIADAVRAVSTLKLDGLRTEWRRRFKDDPPAMRAPELFRFCLTDRIQTQAFDVDKDLQQRIARLVKGQASGRAPGPVRPRFRPGVVLTREHNGRTHQVEVLDDGFQWNGQHYDSLSEIARAITGVRWNGPRFFGLREKAGKP